MYFNSLLFVIEIIVAFSVVVFLAKKFGSSGLIAWAAIAPVIANLTLCKMATSPLGGVSIGNVMFASTFLVTDILAECFSEKEAKKVPWLTAVSVLSYIFFTQIALLFRPDVEDIMDPVMKQLFAVNVRICIASVTFMVLANYIDVLLYTFLRKKFGKKRMWLRNNVCTIVCNCAENFGFTLVAFLGIFPLKVCLINAALASVFEIVVALCDTPFLYWAKRVCSDKQVSCEETLTA